MIYGKPGIKPKDFAHCLRSQHEAVVVRIEKNDTGDLHTMLLDLRAATPKAASVCVLEAVEAMRESNDPAAQWLVHLCDAPQARRRGAAGAFPPRHQNAIRNQASVSPAVPPAA